MLERGIVTITRDVISGTDEDTSDEKLIFLIVNGPQYGVVEKAGTMFCCSLFLFGSVNNMISFQVNSSDMSIGYVQLIFCACVHRKNIQNIMSCQKCKSRSTKIGCNEA